MHSMTIETPEGNWTAMFDGDFSGDVQFWDSSPSAVTTPIPYKVIKAVVAEQVRRSLVAFVEDSSDSEVLGDPS